MRKKLIYAIGAQFLLINMLCIIDSYIVKYGAYLVDHGEQGYALGVAFGGLIFSLVLISYVGILFIISVKYLLKGKNEKTTRKVDSKKFWKKMS